MTSLKERSTIKVEFVLSVRQHAFLEEKAREYKMTLNELVRRILSQSIKDAIESSK